MCDYFDDFEGEFDDGDSVEDDPCEDYCDDGMEGSADPNPDNDLNQEDDQSNGLTWNEVYWSGVGLGFAYEEGRRERLKRKDADSDDPSEID